jgi:hypothetical protein
MGLSSSPEQGHEGHVREVPQEDHGSSMYSNYMQLCVVVELLIMHSRIVLLFLYQGNWYIILIGVYFRRLKINHDSHEFILETGYVANNTHL